MTAAHELTLTQGTWDDAEACIGQELAVIEGVDLVSRQDVRRKLEVLRIESPLNTDDEVARSLGHKAAPAPTTMLPTWVMPAYWAPGDPLDDRAYLPPLPICEIPAPGDSLFATQIRTEYGEPVYPGDRISATSSLVELTRKRTAVGDGAFMTVRTVYTNQDGTMVGVEHVTGFRYQSEATSDADG
jgi:hypothetical protein